MGSFWEELKEFIKQSAIGIADKTEELTKIGKIQVDILGIKRHIEKNFAELGSQIYQSIKDDKKIDLVNNTEMQTILKRVKELEGQLEAKRVKLEEVKKGKARQPKPL